MCGKALFLVVTFLTCLDWIDFSLIYKVIILYQEPIQRHFCLTGRQTLWAPVQYFLSSTEWALTNPGSFPTPQEWNLLHLLFLLLHPPSYPWLAPSFRIPDKLRLSNMPEPDEMEKVQILVSDLSSHYGFTTTSCMTLDSLFSIFIYKMRITVPASNSWCKN